MGDDAKKRIQKVIQEKVKPDADKAFAHALKAVPDLVRSTAKVKDAVKEGVDADLMETYLRELVIRTRAVVDARLYAIQALATLKSETADDGDFAADMEEIEKLQAKLEAVRDKLEDEIVKAKSAAIAGAKAAADGKKSEKTAHREWDTLIAEFDMQNAFLASYMKKMRTLCQEARDAVAKRDATTLTKKKADISHVTHNQDVADGKLLLKRTDAFLARYDLATLSDEFNAQIKDDRAKIVGEYDKRAQTLQAEAEKINAEVDKLQIAPPDDVKCTARLGFKANFNARVEKALKLDEAKLMKELEAIGKDAGVKGTGKEFVDKLKKEKLYP